MRRLLRTLFFLSCLGAPSLSQAGEVISFVNSETGNRIVAIPAANLRALIAEFLDPVGTGIGQSVGYLIWKETLTAISDQSGAGVILARAPEGKNLTELIGNRYHLAAQEIAEFQKASMMLWGAVIENPDGDLTINTHLTLLAGPGKSGKLTVRFTSGRRSSEGLKAAITRSKFNFAALTKSRKDLFARRIIIARKSNMRSGPSQRFPVLQGIQAGTVLRSLDMKGAWFEVMLEDGKTAYIHANQVDLPPKQIDIDKAEINIRAGPGTNHPIVANTSLKGSYDVLDQRYVPGRGLWYSFDLNGRPVWIYAKLVKPRYSLPAVHFLAGLYRYYAGRFDTASTEFEQFVGGDEDRNDVNLSVGYQLLGASRVMGRSILAARRDGISAFDKAVALTPYDPTVYNLRALANIAVTNNLGLAIKDLQQSVGLDKNNQAGAELAKNLLSITADLGGENANLRERLNPLARQIKEIDILQQKFISPGTEE